mmetsp:Transcript_34044/g.73705  ORF Transcript_34044/g.73705 Transcript_34044/m.73705 type:complete len:203 (+) Transcript_34044:310-918(+)
MGYCTRLAEARRCSPAPAAFLFLFEWSSKLSLRLPRPEGPAPGTFATQNAASEAPPPTPRVPPEPPLASVLEQILHGGESELLVGLFVMLLLLPRRGWCVKGELGASVKVSSALGFLLDAQEFVRDVDTEKSVFAWALPRIEGPALPTLLSDVFPRSWLSATSSWTHLRPSPPLGLRLCWVIATFVAPVRRGGRLIQGTPSC